MSKRAREPIYTTAIVAGRVLFGLLRVKPRVVNAANLPDAGGAVLAITHFGYLDFALCEWMMWKHNRRRIRFMAKQSAFDGAVVGALLRGMKHIPVDMSHGAEAYAAAVAALRSGEVLGVFPEGGVNTSFTVRELKTGSVRMAAEAGVPIIPIAIWGGHRLLTKNRRPTLCEAFGAPIDFAVGEPIAIAPDADPRAETSRLHSTLQGLMDDLQTSYPIDGSGAWWQPKHLGGSAPTPQEAAVAEAERRRRREEAAGTV
ncbi:lysophospholipid acyltransferase family protein [Glaciibacter psychrotolerans]|uniref:1-acyl-sn-glycerol-3-phosphate acyltransferase n=1 Tax=Glaciibacter psychrotolerans TaxID=670054 RepID=A0A7Z0J4Y1_9MICO|nr:lysophospholipid acyltransferase family protein [Leifsonia psychrotolerans]NYJ18830.1 1-acyl-sn-glycerol-3-phosphate acyltransferase [Leifsonia psychrotolerans]